MNERFVAVSMVTGSRICGCFSKPRCDFIVTRGWQQVMNAIRWIKQFAISVQPTRACTLHRSEFLLKKICTALSLVHLARLLAMLPAEAQPVRSVDTNIWSATD